MERETASKSKAALVLILGTLTALGPLSIDMYLPALPMLTRDLGAGAAQIQATLSACILGLALGQLLIGPWSDVVGRRPPLFIGLGIYIVASLACSVAPTANWLVVARLAQGIGGSAALVIATATVRDRYQGADAARFFSLLMLVMGLAPILAPLLGAQMLLVWSWHAIFLVLAAAAALNFIATSLFLTETLPAERRHPGGVSAAMQAFGMVLRDRSFCGYALASGLSFAAMFAYIAGSPFVLQDIYGLSPQAFGLLFGINAVGLVAASQVNGRLVHRATPRRMMLIGLAAAALGGTALLVLVALDGPIAAVFAALFVVVASQGLVAPNATALALAGHGQTAGSASALLGASRFLFGAVVAPLVGLLGAGTAWPMAVVMAVCSGAGLAIALTTRVSRLG